MQQIKFAKTTKFTGRNGNFNCTGVELLPLKHNNTVMMSPLTGKGDVGRCDIEVPLEAVPDLVKALEKEAGIKRFTVPGLIPFKKLRTSSDKRLILATISNGEASSVILNGVTIYHEDTDKDYHQNFKAKDVADRLAQASGLTVIKVVLGTDEAGGELWDYDTLQRAALEKVKNA